MGFRNPFSRTVVSREIPSELLLWGVRRRRGYSEIDDPWSHDGLDQHAFVVGNDTAALCGFRPFRWRSPAVPLAIARDENPRCRRCLAVIRTSVSTDERESAAIPQLVPALATIELPEHMPMAPPGTPKRRDRGRPGRRSRTRSTRDRIFPRRDVASRNEGRPKRRPRRTIQFPW